MFVVEALDLGLAGGFLGFLGFGALAGFKAGFHEALVALLLEAGFVEVFVGGVEERE